MRPVKDYYFVEVEKIHEDTIMVNGKELFMDTSFDELKHARNILQKIQDKYGSK